MKFEERLLKIDEITKLLESGNIGIEEAMKSYEIAINECSECLKILKNNKGKIQILNQTIDNGSDENGDV